MSELTPIIKYQGPGVQKKEWTKRGLDILNNMEKFNPNLAVRSTTRHYPDGSVIFAQTISNDIMRVDSLDIKVPVSGGRALELTTEVLSPVLVFDKQDYVQLFIQVKGLADRMKYPDGGTDVMESYKGYGAASDTLGINSLKPIAAEGYSIDFVLTSEVTVDDYAEDPENTCENGAPDGLGGCLDSSLYNNCGGMKFYLDWFTGALYWPPGGVYTITYEYGYINTATIAIIDGEWNVVGTPAGLPSGTTYEYHIEGETVITHEAIGGWDYTDPEGSDPPYYYISSQGYFADCEDNGHVVDDSEVTETGDELNVFIGHSAVVANADGYEDFKTWGAIYGVVDPDTLVIAVYLALCDPETGFRQYKLEDADYTGITKVSDAQGLFCYGKVDIFDFGGKPYFVVNYIGLEAGGGA